MKDSATDFQYVSAQRYHNIAEMEERASEQASERTDEPERKEEQPRRE